MHLVAGRRGQIWAGEGDCWGTPRGLLCKGLTHANADIALHPAKHCCVIVTAQVAVGKVLVLVTAAWARGGWAGTHKVTP